MGTTKSGVIVGFCNPSLEDLVSCNPIAIVTMREGFHGGSHNGKRLWRLQGSFVVWGGQLPLPPFQKEKKEKESNELGPIVKKKKPRKQGQGRNLDKERVSQYTRRVHFQTGHMGQQLNFMAQIM